MTSKIVTRNVASGWNAVRFDGCDVDGDGVIVTGTAESIEKYWGPTEKEAERQARNGGDSA